MRLPMHFPMHLFGSGWVRVNAENAQKPLISLLFIVGRLSIWLDDPARLATAFRLMSAGLAEGGPAAQRSVGRAGGVGQARRHAVDPDGLAPGLMADLQAQFAIASATYDIVGFAPPTMRRGAAAGPVATAGPEPGDR